MKEQICTHETSLLLKQLGFHEEVMDFYFKGKFNDDSDPSGSYTGFGLFEDFNGDKEDYASAPSQSLAMRWLREKKKVDVIVRLNTQIRTLAEMREVKEMEYFPKWVSMAMVEKGCAVFPLAINTDTVRYNLFADKYEDAVEEAIKVACKYLININSTNNNE